MDAYMGGTYVGISIKEFQIPHLSDTAVLGEKMTEAQDYYMDLLEVESGMGVGNDLFRLDRSRHGGNGQKNSASGGSNYAFADNSVRFVKYGEILGPLNLWAVSDASRVSKAVLPQ
jgi:prepilin-type processing-associated H-X9-DG protein